MTNDASRDPVIVAAAILLWVSSGQSRHCPVMTWQPRCQDLLTRRKE
jgi:hypothetical protein